MPHVRASGPSGARPRARVAAWLSGARGDTLIEVIVGALLVALIAAAVMNGYIGAGHLSADQRHRVQATALAQQDEQRLRGLTVTQLDAAGAGNGNTSTTLTIDGTAYRITSSSQFVSGTNGNAACNAGQATGTADEVATTSTVTWGNNNTNDNRAPVIVHGLVTPSVGGALIASATTPGPGTTPVGLAGVNVALTGGPSATTPLLTDDSGCAIFTGLTGGSYTATFTAPANYVDINGLTTIAPQTKTVTNTQTQTASVGPLALGGSVQACFTTWWAGSWSPSTTCPVPNGSGGGNAQPNQADQFVLAGGPMTGAARVFGTDSTATSTNFASSLTTPQTIFPTANGGGYPNYTAYAGQCAADLPPTASNMQQSVPVTAGATSNVVLPEPAMYIAPYTKEWLIDDPASSTVSYSGSHWTSYSGSTYAADYDSTETDDSGTLGDSVTFTLPAGTSSFTYYYNKASSYGDASVKVDNGTATTVHQYQSSGTTHDAAYGPISVSTGSQHTVTITVLHTDTTGGSNNYKVTVDALLGTYGAATLMTTVPDITVIDTGCSNNEDYPPEQVPTTAQGALAYPGMPYGTYTVCVDDGQNHDTLTINNTTYGALNKPTGNSPTAGQFSIWSGATGYGTGVCT